MKSIFILIGLIFVQFAQAATWTFHTFEGEYFRCVWSQQNGDTYFYQSLEWSQYDYGGWYGFKQITQQLPDGTWTNISTDIIETTGTWSTDLPVYYAYNTGPGPNYDYPNGWFDVSIPAEYWIDFDSTGSARASTVRPVDFGKYLWDGSINPSWVEPVSAKKQHGKGRNK